jgi:hypothetical protein
MLISVTSDEDAEYREYEDDIYVDAMHRKTFRGQNSPDDYA